MNEIALNQKCLLIRGGVELWVDGEQAKRAEEALQTQKYIKVNGSTIATFEVVGIFTPEHMEERTRRYNGQWKCEKGFWHDKNMKCECRDKIGKIKAVVEGIGEIEYTQYE